MNSEQKNHPTARRIAKTERMKRASYKGIAKLDLRTKNLVKRLKAEDIAIIDHPDLDRVSAEALLDTKAKVVVNASSFSTGRYPNAGPYLLAVAGVYLVDGVGDDIFRLIKEGQTLTVRDGDIFLDGELVARGEVLTLASVKRHMEESKKKLGVELEKFADNTLSYLKKEKEFLFGELEIPPISTKISGRQVLLVVRGYDYKEDLKTLRSYIREVRPVLIGVDGGADALLAEGYKPDMIIGDMDSVTDKALMIGAELIVHAYRDGRCPGLYRLEKLGLKPKIFKSAGTSEDIALLLAYEEGADLIAAVGGHANLVEFLDKGREGMASTFLARLRVGDRLVDAKGVNKLYRSQVKVSHLIFLVLATVTALSAVVIASPTVRNVLTLSWMRLKLLLF